MKGAGKRQLRLLAGSILLLVYASSVWADSTLIRGGKLPPPPPPPPRNQEKKIANVSTTSSKKTPVCAQDEMVTPQSLSRPPPPNFPNKAAPPRDPSLDTDPASSSERSKPSSLFALEDSTFSLMEQGKFKPGDSKKAMKVPPPPPPPRAVISKTNENQKLEAVSSEPLTVESLTKKEDINLRSKPATYTSNISTFDKNPTMKLEIVQPSSPSHYPKKREKEPEAKDQQLKVLQPFKREPASRDVPEMMTFDSTEHPDGVTKSFSASPAATAHEGETKKWQHPSSRPLTQYPNNEQSQRQPQRQPQQPKPPPLYPRKQQEKWLGPSSGTGSAWTPPRAIQDQSTPAQMISSISQQHMAGPGASSNPPANRQVRHSYGYNEPQTRIPPSQHARQYDSRPPANGRHTKRPSGITLGTSALKSLWGRVEKGLDGLAGLEDSVSGRAQKIMSSVAPIRKQYSNNGGRASAQQGRPRPSPAANPVNTAFQPYGNKFQVARQQNAASKKLIRANGGASAPNGQHPQPPLFPGSTEASSPPSAHHQQLPQTQQPQQQSYQAVTPKPADATGNGGVTTEAPRTAQPGNIYAQMGNPPTRPAVTQSADAHSRQNRIPWDTSAASPRPTPPTSSAPAPQALKEYTLKESLISRIMKSLPRLPKLPSLGRLFRFGRKNSYDYAAMDAWQKDESEDSKGLFGFFGKKKSEKVVASPSYTRATKKGGDDLTPPLSSMLSRCKTGSKSSLLTADDERQCRSLGRYQASLDILCALFVLVGVQLTDLGNIALPITMAEVTAKTLPQAVSALQNSLQTWAPFAFAYAYLAFQGRKALFDTKMDSMAVSIEAAVQEEALYAQLYLRLAAALPMDTNLPTKLGEAASLQVKSLVSTARSSSFATMVLCTLVVMTVSLIGPVFSAIVATMTQLLTMDELRSWPIVWSAVGTTSKAAFQSLYLTVESVLAKGMTGFLNNPVQFAFHLSLIGALLAVSVLPSLETRRHIPLSSDDEEELTTSSKESAALLSTLGASSASRLSLLSENGSIENALERWRVSKVVPPERLSRLRDYVPFRNICYSLLTSIIVATPVIVSYLIGESSNGRMFHIGLQWDSVVDVAVILLFVYFLLNNAMKDAIASSRTRGTVQAFLSVLSKTMAEIQYTNKQQADIQFMASVSPTAGLLVKDLWAAHTAKRAWAVRGANLQCKNGEVLAILGDDGAGKTRMLTTIAESLVSPPKRSLTSNKVRGYIAIGGVESSKWDSKMLKRRLGILLSDVRSMADTANLFSGWTVEEILEPIDGLRTLDQSHKLGSSEKSAMILGLKIAGLYSSLIPKLPSKLSTVLSANEEDLRPSALRPRSSVLSPAEWSKLLLAKVITQTTYDNDNAAASSDKVDSCLMGSVLILDDPTVLLSEVEEAKVLRELRQTGAATVLSTNKWATGRFADHIAVVKDGAIVETGTHNELIARGPQQSLYAAKWHAMTMQ